MQRITDIWQNLVRYLPNTNDQVVEDQEEEADDERQERDEQLEESYKNLYWTRLIRIEDFETGTSRKHVVYQDAYFLTPLVGAFGNRYRNGPSFRSDDLFRWEREIYGRRSLSGYNPNYVRHGCHFVRGFGQYFSKFPSSN